MNEIRVCIMSHIYSETDIFVKMNVQSTIKCIINLIKWIGNICVT